LFYHDPSRSALGAGFEVFIRIIANNTVRDSIHGTVYRVVVGAALSTIDTAADIYVISTYYQSKVLYGQAHALLAMISTNLFVQILMVLAQYVASERRREAVRKRNKGRSDKY